MTFYCKNNKHGDCVKKERLRFNLWCCIDRKQNKEKAGVIKKVIEVKQNAGIHKNHYRKPGTQKQISCKRNSCAEPGPDVALCGFVFRVETVRNVKKREKYVN